MLKFIVYLQLNLRMTAICPETGSVLHIKTDNGSVAVGIRFGRKEDRPMALSGHIYDNLSAKQYLFRIY